MSQTVSSLDVNLLTALFEPNGLLSQALPGFEARPQQLSMLSNIVEAYNNREIALIEAGTGTGKSIAYLIPALQWASIFQEKTVISTNTIHLQEQLLNKDIPVLLKALKLDLKAVLVKGMSNYICYRKLYDSKEEKYSFAENERVELDKIEVWAEKTNDGSKSDLPFVPNSHVWERVCAERDACSAKRCPHYDQCHFFKARKEANDAQILVVNHHILLADIVSRSEDDNYSEISVLPPYSRIILDEAHSFEDIATEHFADRVSQIGLIRILNRFSHEKHGKLTLLNNKLFDYFKGIIPANISTLLTIDLPGERQDIFLAITKLFQTLEAYMQFKQAPNTEDNNFKLRILSKHLLEEIWQQQVQPAIKQLHTALVKTITTHTTLENALNALKAEELQLVTASVRFDIASLAGRLMQTSQVFELFTENLMPNHVRWLEAQASRDSNNLLLVDAQLDVSKVLVKYLFSKFATVVLCSATLTTNRSFEFIRKRLGLTGETCLEHTVKDFLYDSPFDYQKQALLAIPTDIPVPSHINYEQAAAEQILEIVRISRGNAFVLFTSYSMLNNCYHKIVSRLTEGRFHVLKQGQDSRKALLHKFRTTDRSILFGTDSFWEGVDVVGEALRCVILTKLPFKVPSEPIIQARSEAIKEAGGDPFMEYMLPLAIVKFKQGFGRLIRNKKDRGCVICLDERLLSKGYGRFFLNSLPACQYAFENSLSMQKSLKDFYQKRMTKPF